MMRYASVAAERLPVGSGATEGTCWQMQRRVKRTGQSWEPRGLRGILAIRGLVLSERWPAAWKSYAATHRKECDVRHDQDRIRLGSPLLVSTVLAVYSSSSGAGAAMRFASSLRAGQRAASDRCTRRKHEAAV
jgi:hypothetical protein